MSLAISLSFPGNCAEAFEHYKLVFGAKEFCQQTFRDAPSETFPNADPDRIMHTSLLIGGTMLMGCDVPAETDGVKTGDNVSIVFCPESSDEADSQFEQLAEGGTVTMSLQETFWGSYFGMCTDRFGVHWKFNMPIKAA